MKHMMTQSQKSAEQMAERHLHEMLAKETNIDPGVHPWHTVHLKPTVLPELAVHTEKIGYTEPAVHPEPAVHQQPAVHPQPKEEQEKCMATMAENCGSSSSIRDVHTYKHLVNEIQLN